MTTSQLCLFIVALLPFPLTLLAKARKGYDNHTPRAYLAKLEGWRARAQAAHQNAWEALALFIAALVVAWHNGANAHHVDKIAMGFVAIRVVYTLMYLLNWASLRSLVWFGQMVCVVALFFAAP
ncbi:MAPEG family protein [Burkholderia ambifaria]|uniref:Membrane protein-like protein n=1 Tax=Burkholderia ambifaria MEX-5 TaxID=396597 RepID=B1T8I4_9BURK|nr:MAPEG family protein [Burkholderia ambifaria]EDT40114.1 membrane protein-like protein [Burkholderia ambifaria MEX-5]